MSSALQSPFMEDGIHEVVPDVGKLGSKLSASSVIAARRRVRIVPQSGQNYTIGAGGGANTINILIQDGQSYADLLSAALNFEVEVFDSANETGTTMALDDGAFCVFRRALVSLNSTLMDDIDLLPKKVLQETYATVDDSWYTTVGSWMGLYKAGSSGAYGVNLAGDSFVGKYNVPTKLALAAQRQFFPGTDGLGTPAVPGQNKFTVPVCMLSSFFRNETLFPLRNAGQLYLQLNLASAVEACVGSRATGTITPNYRIKNLTLDMDFVDMHPMYLSMMDSTMERPEEDGVRWPFDAHLVSAQNLPAGNGQQNVILSKASQNLRQIAIGVQPQAGLSQIDYPKQSTWANPGFVDVQCRVGSLYFPAFNSVGEHRAYSDLQNAYGSPASLDKSGLVDVRNYYQSTPYGAGKLVDGSTRVAYSDMWLWSYCFDRLKRAKLEGLDLDGINTLSTSGSQIVVQLNCNLGDGVVPGTLGSAILTGILRFTRVMEIRGGATRVIG